MKFLFPLWHLQGEGRDPLLRTEDEQFEAKVKVLSDPLVARDREALLHGKDLRLERMGEYIK